MPEFSAEFWVATIIAVFTFLVGLAVTLAMDAKTKGEFRVAGSCFLLTATIAVYGIGVWEMSTSWSARIRIPVALVLFAIVAVLTFESLRWARIRHLKAAAKEGPSVAVPSSRPVELTAKLIGSIDQVYVAGDKKDARTVGETLIILVVTIQNTGDPTTVVDYRLEVDIPNRARPEFSLAKIPDTLQVPGRTATDKNLVFYATDFLPDKTFSNPLTKEAPVRGIVVFASTSVKPPELYQPGVGLSLIFKDVKGLYYKMTMPSLNLGKVTGQAFLGLRSGPTGK